MNVYQKLALVQGNLKAPKGQYNSFGKYHYRSCEDILTAVKPLCIENGLVLTISDEIKQVGDRYYVEARATVILLETGEKHTVCASARESQDKKGMDDSQITGTASSYARKYALNGLFAIDDSKDADTDEHAKETQSKATKGNDKVKYKAEDMILLAATTGITQDQILAKYKVASVDKLTQEMLANLHVAIEARLSK